MPAQLPHRPPLAFRLWLAQRFGWGKPEDSAASGHKAMAMSVESFEHIVRGRVRMFLRHTWLVAILGTLILGAGIWGAIYITTAPTDMRIAAGPPGSANVKLVQLMAQKFAAEHDNVRLHLVATDGPNESAGVITNGAADLAVVPGTIGNSPNLPVVAILQQNVMALIVPTPPPSPPAAAPKKEPMSPAKAETSVTDKKEKPAKAAKSGRKTKAANNDDNAKSEKSEKGDKAAKAAKTASKNADRTDDTDAADDGGTDTDAADANKLDKVSKLAGKRIGIVTGSVATRDLLDLVLNHYGVPLSQVQVSLIEPKKVADAVKAQQIEVLFAAGSATGHAINDAVTAATIDGRAPSFIPIDQAEGIANRHPAFASADIDAGTFGGNPPAPDDDLKSLSFPEYLVARKSFSHDGVAALARLIYSSRLALAAAMPGEIKIAAPSTDKDASVIVHPGALAYLTDDQKTFFDKYGDDIFYGLLIFPIFGSAIAGVASYFRNSGRTRRLRLLQSLLDLVHKANTASSLEALDAIQAEVDHLVTGIIHLSEREEYDQNMQMSFSLALDQARFAIASRRSLLLEGGPIETKPGTKAAAA